MHDGAGCGPLYACYVAARSGDVEAMRTAWDDVDPDAIDADDAELDEVEDALSSADTDRATAILADIVFADEPDDRLDGPPATVVGTLLWAFGYVAAFVLFFRAHTREAVVSRLRWAYATVGVDIRAVESVETQDTRTSSESIAVTERTVFRCPYRNVGADRWGQRRLCHDVLDRVDDGYVTFLQRHRDLDYDRPRPCAGGLCCYSEVTER